MVDRCSTVDHNKEGTHPKVLCPEEVGHVSNFHMTIMRNVECNYQPGELCSDASTFLAGADPGFYEKTVLHTF